jgi:hypothetical protein
VAGRARTTIRSATNVRNAVRRIKASSLDDTEFPTGYYRAVNVVTSRPRRPVRGRAGASVGRFVAVLNFTLLHEPASGAGIYSVVKPIYITRHARNRMRWHGIAESLIHDALDAPDLERPSSSGRVNAWRFAGDRALRVTYREDVDVIVIISAVFKRRRTGGRERV